MSKLGNLATDECAGLSSRSQRWQRPAVGSCVLLCAALSAGCQPKGGSLPTDPSRAAEASVLPDSATRRLQLRVSNWRVIPEQTQRPDTSDAAAVASIEFVITNIGQEPVHLCWTDIDSLVAGTRVRTVGGAMYAIQLDLAARARHMSPSYPPCGFEGLGVGESYHVSHCATSDFRWRDVSVDDGMVCSAPPPGLATVAVRAVVCGRDKREQAAEINASFPVMVPKRLKVVTPASGASGKE